jgi:hypothetical protein
MGTSLEKRRKDAGWSVLLRELQHEDRPAYENFLRMDKETFDMLLEKIRLQIQRKDTVMRGAIPADLKLVVTLRFLATGELQTLLKPQFINIKSIYFLGCTYMDQEFNCRIPKVSQSIIIPQVCSAIVSALRPDYLKVILRINK